jgi:hypothetical protein
MTWPNRLGKLKHKFIKEKDMKAEAIQALQLFKQQHLARPVVEVDDGQADTVSESLAPTEENQMLNEQATLGDLLSEWEKGTKEAGQPKTKSINYPDHIKPLQERMTTALNNGARTVDTIAKYCKEGEKLVRLQLNLMVSRGKIGRQLTPASGITRYYPHDIAKQMGILTAPQPINYNTKARRAEKLEEEKKRSSHVPTPQPVQTDTLAVAPIRAKEEKYILFLEKRMVEWQTECRKMAKETDGYKAQVVELEAKVIKAKTEPRNITGELTEVMKEVMELRATVTYLESKLFGSK